MNSESKTVQYSHDFNRPSAIHYPLHPENDVHYTYGSANAGNNRAGRLVLQEDGSGAQEFQYGRQGELTKTILIPITPSVCLKWSATRLFATSNLLYFFRNI